MDNNSSHSDAGRRFYGLNIHSATFSNHWLNNQWNKGDPRIVLKQAVPKYPFPSELKWHRTSMGTNVWQ